MRTQSSIRAAFTLGEALVLLGLLLVLGAVVVPVLGRYREPSYRGSCKFNLMQIGKGLIVYQMHFADYLPYTEWSPHPANSLALLYPRFLTQARILRCPSTEDVPEITGRWVGGGYQASFGASPHWSSYGYDHRVDHRRPVSNHAIAADMDGAWASDPESPTSNHSSGQYVFYFDGHVSWQTTNFCSTDPNDNIFVREFRSDPDTDSCIKRTVGD